MNNSNMNSGTLNNATVNNITISSAIKLRRKISAGQIAAHIILALLILLLLYPLGMALWGGFKSQAQFDVSKWYPTLPLNFTNLSFAVGVLWTFVLNTLLVGGVGTAGMLIVSALGAYAFARFEFPGKKALYILVIAIMMISAIMTLVPSFVLYKKLVGVNTYMILILPVITGGSVFGVFLLRFFFEGIPESIFEAARADGASELRVFLTMCVPLSIPILATLAIMQLTGVWNDYIWPMIAIPTASEKLTISAAIRKEFLSAYGDSYPTLFAGYLFSALPLILLFVFANKYYIDGLTSAAIKF